jgi:hypothetical protein
MGIANGLTIPNNIANGNALDAPTAMANWNALLVALNRALLDAGNGNGMAAAGSQIHNLGAGTASTDAINLGQVSGVYLPLTGGTLTGPLAATAGLTAATQAVNDNTTAVATDAFVQTQLAASLATYATLVSPAFTGVPTAPTAAVGTNTTQIATTAFAIANGGMGSAAQAWTNETVSRAFGTTYTNGTGKGISVCVSLISGSGNLQQAVTVGGNIIAYIPNYNSLPPFPFTFNVPSGATYSITGGAGGPLIGSWWEMR